MFGRKKTEKKTYDREKLRPVLKCSICNGEQVAGFREIQTGRFQEVMFIRNEKDLEEFLRTYDLSEIDRDY